MLLFTNAITDYENTAGRCNMNLRIDDFGQKLKYIRELRELTQKELSRKTGISSQALSNLERGYTKALSITDLERLSEALDCSIGDFLPSAYIRQVDYPIELESFLEDALSLLNNNMFRLKGKYLDAKTTMMLKEVVFSSLRMLDINNKFD